MDIHRQQTPKKFSDVLKILICYYDSYGLPPLDDGIFLPVQAGKAIADRDLHIQGDNELNGQPCDNISDKNPTYSEFTALYWAWKNLKKLYPDVRYVGWTHYRRFFAFNEKMYFESRIWKPVEEIKDYRIDPQKIIDILESGKIIVAKKDTFYLPLHMQYSHAHNSEDYRTLKELIKEKFPDYYDDFINFMEKNNKMFSFCMFIMKYEDFEKYCEWIFSVLAELEYLVPFQCYNPYQKRVLAFMGERLFNVYIRKNKIPTEELNVYLYKNLPARKSIFRKIFSWAYRFYWYICHLHKYLKKELTFRVILSNKEKSPKS